MSETNEQTQPIDQSSSITINITDLVGKINHGMWLTYTKLYSEVIRKGGILFGGCVRDYYDRNYFANKFYEYCESQNIDSSVANSKYYNDKTFHPETFKSRVLLPNDIDIFCNEQQQDKILACIREFYILKEVNKDEPSYFIKKSKLHEKALIHRKFTCKILGDVFDILDMAIVTILRLTLGNKLLRLINSKSFKIDLIVLRDEYSNMDSMSAPCELVPPFGKADIRCNMIYMAADSKSIYSLLESRTTKIKVFTDYIKHTLDSKPLRQMKHCGDFRQSLIEDECRRAVFDDIINKKAVIVNDKLPIYRINKMIKKGYEIVSKPILETFEFTLMIDGHESIRNLSVVCEATTDVCVICQDSFTETDMQIHYGCTCTARYHPKCLETYIVTHHQQTHGHSHNFDELRQIVCPMCRTPCSCMCNLASFLQKISHRCGEDDCPCIIQACEFIEFKCVCRECMQFSEDAYRQLPVHDHHEPD